MSIELVKQTMNEAWRELFPPSLPPRREKKERVELRLDVAPTTLMVTLVDAHSGSSLTVGANPT